MRTENTRIGWEQQQQKLCIFRLSLGRIYFYCITFSKIYESTDDRGVLQLVIFTCIIFMLPTLPS